MGHTLSRQQRPPYAEDRFFCNLCQEEGCGPLYHCSDCDYDVHVHCAATEKQQTHFIHPQHPLHLTHCSLHARICDSCGCKIHMWSFRCETCDFDMHPTCVRAPRCILHPRHPHPLTLLQQLPELSSRPECSMCLRPITKQFYHCGMCAFTLHQVCATLPTKVKHLKHPPHALAMLDRLPEEGLAIACGECGEQVQGWHLSCASCNFHLHPVCANLVHDYPHANIGSSLCEQNLSAVSSAIWAPRDVLDESRDAEGSSPPSPPSIVRSEETEILPICTRKNGRSSATTTPATSSVTNLLHTFMPSTLHTSSQIPFPSKEDWETAQRVLRFAQEMAKVSSSHAAQKSAQSHPDDGLCPACHKGYDCWNPKTRTSCGHYFHLACALDGLQRSNFCPICDKNLKILM